MKKFITPILSLLFFSCSQHSKVYNEFKRKCMDDLKDAPGYREIGAPSPEKTCDCFARNLSAKYKTVEDVMKDRQAAMDMLEACKQLSNKK
jgi:hypothetical protein